MANVLEPHIERAPARQSSDRNFGLVFAAALTTIAFVPLLHHGSPRWWALGAAILFAAAALLWPQILRWPNRAWLAFGELLHRIVSPLIMGAVFFLCVTPIAWIMRLRGKDLLSLRRRPDLDSYWIERDAAEPASQSMKHQY